MYLTIKTTVRDGHGEEVVIGPIGPFSDIFEALVWRDVFRGGLRRANGRLGLNDTPEEIGAVLHFAPQPVGQPRPLEDWAPYRTAAEIEAKYRTIHNLSAA